MKKHYAFFVNETCLTLGTLDEIHEITGEDMNMLEALAVVGELEPYKLVELEIEGGESK